VYLATKPSNAKPEVPIPTNQLSFVKVYDNPTPTCTITHDNLRYAYYDVNGAKPAIIFRIAAKNEKGYGPATQVRWLQGIENYINFYHIAVYFLNPSFLL
jgi:host cell factor